MVGLGSCTAYGELTELPWLESEMSITGLNFERVECDVYNAAWASLLMQLLSCVQTGGV